jgi:hypothetical protein
MISCNGIELKVGLSSRKSLACLRERTQWLDLIKLQGKHIGYLIWIYLSIPHNFFPSFLGPDFGINELSESLTPTLLLCCNFFLISLITSKESLLKRCWILRHCFTL